MKTDAQLQREVLDELAWDPRIDHAGIGVAVHNGVVTFSGFVGDYSQKEVVESIARRIVGVKGIAEEIIVRFPSDPKTSDAEIAERVIDLFKWDVGIPSDKISVKVERHWVTLSGTVDWHFQRDLARRAAGRITGVLGVTNLLVCLVTLLLAVFSLPADIKSRAIQTVTTKPVRTAETAITGTRAAIWVAWGPSNSKSAPAAITREATCRTCAWGTSL